MPTLDKYGQGVPITLLSDKPDANTLAEPIVNGLAGRVVMRFDSAAQRDATITAPEEGMVAWLRVPKLLTLYDGGAWAVLAAGSQAWTTINLATGFGHNGNSNGTFQYRRVNFFGEPTLMFRGGITVSYTGNSIPNGGDVTRDPLPVGFRPTTLRTITVPCSDASSGRIALKVDCLTSGHIRVLGTGAGNTPPWVSFNGTFVSL